MLGSVVDCQPLGSAAPGAAAFGATVPRRSVCCQSSNILRARRRGGTCWARSESMGMPLSCTFWRTWRTSGQNRPSLLRNERTSSIIHQYLKSSTSCDPIVLAKKTTICIYLSRIYSSTHHVLHLLPQPVHCLGLFIQHRVAQQHGPGLGQFGGGMFFAHRLVDPPLLLEVPVADQ